MIVYVLVGVIVAAVIFVGMAIVGAGMRISQAILALVGLLQDLRDRRS